MKFIFTLLLSATSSLVFSQSGFLYFGNTALQSTDSIGFGDYSVYNTDSLVDTLVIQSPPGVGGVTTLSFEIQQNESRYCRLSSQNGTQYNGTYSFSKDLFALRSTTLGPIVLNPGDFYYLPVFFAPQNAKKFSYFGTTTDGVTTVFMNCTNVGDFTYGVGKKEYILKVNGSINQKGNAIPFFDNIRLTGTGNYDAVTAVDERLLIPTYYVNGTSINFEEKLNLQLFDMSGRLILNEFSNILDMNGKEGLFLLQINNVSFRILSTGSSLAVSK